MFCNRMIYVIGLTIASFSNAIAEDTTNKLSDIADLISYPIIDTETPLSEVRAFIKTRILPMSHSTTVEDWTRRAEKIRRNMLDHVVFRGEEAVRWRKSKTKVEWLDTISGGSGYRIRKLRYEALPGLWIPALLYEPKQLSGKVPVVLNLNGHVGEPGKAIAYKQRRCINLAKRGMLALNVEWIGMGQLQKPGYDHSCMNQLDLCGTSGLSVFYLSMSRALDLLMAHENADPKRVAVAGLSGGGWQTVLLSSLDTRVTLANPVAGYSSFFTRVSETADLGDSEQTPVDMATIADYCHLTAMRAPRPTLLTYNAKDNCCFVAGGALPPLLKAAGPVFQLYGKRANLRSHVNYIPGTHNFDLENRLELYRMLGEHFFASNDDYPLEEIACKDELKTKEQLYVDLPANNANFNTLAVAISKILPKGAQLPASTDEALAWQTARRKRLVDIVKSEHYDVESIRVSDQAFEGGTAIFWQLKIGKVWTVPAVELVRGDPTSTVVLVADGGRNSVTADAKKLLDAGHRVLAIDPFYFGESAIPTHDFLFALLVSSVGERPLGIDASQIAAITRWAKNQYNAAPIEIHAIGPRSSLYSLVAASLEIAAIDELNLHGSLGSLKEIIEQNKTVQESPDLFCFGLLEHFDIKQLAALVAPRRVTFIAPSQRVRDELAGLKAFYEMLGVEFDPLP